MDVILSPSLDSILIFFNFYGPFLFREGFWYFSYRSIKLRKDEHGNDLNSIMRQGEVWEDAKRIEPMVEFPL